jgi:hypothetical protein
MKNKKTRINTRTKKLLREYFLNAVTLAVMKESATPTPPQ